MVGYDVVVAEDGEEAVNVFNKTNPDLVVLDVMMPKMNGYEATQEIRKLMNRKLADIPIIAMTANAFEEDRIAALKAGMNDHLAKPIHLEKLYEIVFKYL